MVLERRPAPRLPDYTESTVEFGFSVMKAACCETVACMCLLALSPDDVERSSPSVRESRPANLLEPPQMAGDAFGSLDSQDKSSFADR